MLARTQDRAPDEVHEGDERDEPPAEGEGRRRIRDAQQEHHYDERDERDDDQRAPDAHREVGQVDIAVPEVGELVQHDGPEGARVPDEQRDEAAGEAQLAPRRRPEREPERTAVQRSPPEGRGRVDAQLAGQVSHRRRHRRGGRVRKRDVAPADPQEGDRHRDDAAREQQDDTDQHCRSTRLVHRRGARPHRRQLLVGGNLARRDAEPLVAIEQRERVASDVGRLAVEPVERQQAHPDDRRDEQREPEGRVGREREWVQAHAGTPEGGT